MTLSFNTGSGASLSFSGSIGSVVSISGPEQEVDDIEVSHLGTTGFKEYIPGELKEGGEVEVELLFIGEALPALRSINTLTLTYPALPSGGTGATLTGTAYVKAVSYPEMSSGDILQASVTFKFDGDTDPVFTAASGS